MASIELRTPKNKPAYYKITASITLNGQTIRKFSRFEFDPKTLKTAISAQRQPRQQHLNLKQKHRKKPSAASAVPISHSKK